MIKEGASVLVIQGKVKKKVLKKVTDDYSPPSNQQWYFVDYSAADIPLHAKFDVLLEGENKQLLSTAGAYTIRLLTCLDQFGNKLTSIPKGFKTICKLEAQPSFPPQLRNIHFLDQWDYNPDAISIVHHKDVQLGISDEVLISLCLIVFAYLKENFHSEPKKSPLHKKDLVDYLTKSFQTAPKTADKILRALMQMGKVTRKKGNELELSD